MTDASSAEAGRTRVAVVGAGFGRYALAPAFRRDPRCEVVAICARSPESANRAASELGIERVYTDPVAMLDAGSIDAIAIATPPHVQPAVAMLALARAMPVFLEKLLALSVEDARVLTAAAQRAGVANVVDYIFPELEPWRACRALLDEGFVGSLRHLTVRWMLESYDNRCSLETWKTDPALGGGALSHFGPHMFYYVEWLMGPIERLSATLSRAPDSRRPGDTAVALSLQFVSGATASVSLSTAAPFGSGHHVEIYGSEGALVLANDGVDHVRGFRLLVGNRASNELTEVRMPTSTGPRGGIDARVEPVSRLTSRFVDWIRTGRETRPSFREGLRVQVLLEAANHSHLMGCRVAVPVD